MSIVQEPYGSADNGQWTNTPGVRSVTLLKELRGAGLKVTRTGPDGLKVGPSCLLTHRTRRLIAEHKADLLAELQRECPRCHRPRDAELAVGRAAIGPVWCVVA